MRINKKIFMQFIKRTKIWKFLFGKKESILITEEKESLCETPTPEFSCIPNAEIHKIYWKENQQPQRIKSIWEEAEEIEEMKKNNAYPIIDKETLFVPNKPKTFKKYGYDEPLVIKMINLTDSNDVKVFISVKDFCETLGEKPKKFYNTLNSESKNFNNKYKIEVCEHPFGERIHQIKVDKISKNEYKVYVKPIAPIKFIDVNFKISPTGFDFNLESELKKRVDNMKKRKFVSISEKAPQLIEEWDELLNGISADKVPHGIKEKAAWTCPLCGQSYTRRIDDRVRRAEPGCTKCYSKRNNNIQE